jgi:hypothetical protein
MPYASAELSHETESDFVRVLLKTDGVFTALPVIAVLEGNRNRRVQVIQTDYNFCTATFRPMESYTGNRTVFAEAEVNGKVRTVEHQLEVFTASQRSATFAVDDRRFIVNIDSASFFKPTLLEIARSWNEGSSISYSLLPRFTVLDRGITVKLKSAPHLEKLALYYRNDTRGDWSFASRTREGDYLVDTLTRWLGDVSLQQDTEPPRVWRLSVPSKWKRQPHVISFRFRDNLSGVEYKELKLYIDNVFVVPEIDGEHRRVVNRLPEPLARGTHSIRILLKDKLGNTNDIRRTFRVR